MRAVFMGTPEFAVPTLEAAAEACDLRAVVTQPDRPRGRGKKVTPCPVKARALELGIPVLQPLKIRDPEFLEELRALDPQVILVLAYARLIPPSILELPRYGCVNVHPSILPRYRGANPIRAAVMNGDELTGVCTFVMDEGYDTGDLLLCTEVPIGPEETGEELERRLSGVCAHVLKDTVRALEEGTAVRRPQPAEGEYTSKLEKEDLLIDWAWPSERIRNFVRALAHDLGAATTYAGERVQVGRVRRSLEPGQGEPGTVVGLSRREGPIVATGDGCVVVQEVKPPGKGWMEAWAFVQGRRVGEGDRLGG